MVTLTHSVSQEIEISYHESPQGHKSKFNKNKIGRQTRQRRRSNEISISTKDEARARRNLPFRAALHP